MNKLTPLAEDLLHGADAIAEYIWGTGADPQRVYALRRKKGAPIFSLGNQLCARRSSLLTWIETLETASSR